MATRIALPVRSPRILPILSILLSVICAVGSGAAQPGGGGGGGGGHGGGGGGGHFGGGHSFSGHSGGNHGGGHFGWVRAMFGKHSDRHAGSGTSSAEDVSSNGMGRLWNIPTPVRTPSTFVWSPPNSRATPNARLLSFFPVCVVSGGFPPQLSALFFLRMLLRRCDPGLLLRTILVAAWLRWWLRSFYPGFGFGEDSATLGDDLNEGLMQSEISEVPPTTNPGDDDAAQKKLPANPGANSGAVSMKTRPWAGESSCWC